VSIYSIFMYLPTDLWNQQAQQSWWIDIDHYERILGGIRIAY